MQIVSIQVGRPTVCEYKGAAVTTSIFKTPVSGPVMLRFLNLDGDHQADLRVHGGRDKALYAYPFDSYPEWQKIRPDDKLLPGAFGENLCMATLNEKEIYIGDEFALGEAVVQVTEPRFPCVKLAVKFNDPSILKQFVEFERPGVYFRILQEGRIQPGDSLQLKAREKVKVSIWDVFRVKFHPPERAMLERALKIQSLNADWRLRFEKLLAQISPTKI